MALTREVEEMLVKKYNPFMWSVVHRFKKRFTSTWNNLDDLHQEVMIVFVQHIRSCETEDDVKSIPVRDMVNAMCHFVLRDQVVSIPQRTTEFSEMMVYLSDTICGSELGEYGLINDGDIDEMINRIDLDIFLSNEDDLNNEIVHLKTQGYSNRETSQRLGVGDTRVHRELSRMRRRYMRTAI